VPVVRCCHVWRAHDRVRAAERRYGRGCQYGAGVGSTARRDKADVRSPLGHSRSRRGDLEKGERVAAVRAQRTVRCDVHVVPFCAPSLAAYHACECAADALSGIGICPSRVSARVIVRAAGDPSASIGTNAMYGGASVLLPGAEAGMSHAGGWPLALHRGLSARSAWTTGGRRRPIAGRVSGARRKGTRSSWEKWGRKLSQASSTLIRLSCVIMAVIGDRL